jgi:CBS domain-containing protein
MLKVKDILKTKGNNVWSIAPRELAYKALEIMAEKDIGALMVIDEGRLVGIFSERDYARKVILKGKSSKETYVGELMTDTVFSISPEKSIEECMAMMRVSLGDVVSAIITSQKIEIQDLKSYMFGSEHSSEWSAS